MTSEVLLHELDYEKIQLKREEARCFKDLKEAHYALSIWPRNATLDLNSIRGGSTQKILVFRECKDKYEARSINFWIGFVIYFLL
jgi:hypothetical protein